MDDETGSAVGFYFIVVAFLIGSVIASIFFEISFKTPITVLVIGLGIVFLFGGFRKKSGQEKKSEEIQRSYGTIQKQKV